MQQIIRFLLIGIIAFYVISLIYVHIEALYTARKIFYSSIAFAILIEVLQSALKFTHTKLKDIRLKNTDFELTENDLKTIALRYQLNYFNIGIVLVGLINLFFFLADGIEFEREYPLLITGLYIVVPFWGYFKTKRSISKKIRLVKV